MAKLLELNKMNKNKLLIKISYLISIKKIIKNIYKPWINKFEKKYYFFKSININHVHILL